MSNNRDEYIDGVKIQKLPTYGKPLSYKTRKQRGYCTNLEYKLRSKTGKKLLAIARVLSQKD